MKIITSSRLFKAAHAFYSNVDAPKPRNFTKEMLQTLHGYQQTWPGYLEAERQAQPQYADLARQIQARNLFGTTDTPGTLRMGGDANTYTRRRDIGDVARYGPAATTAFLRSNPYLAGSLNNLYGRMGDSPLLNRVNAQSMAGSPILSTLNQQALSGLRANGKLSPQELRDVTQASRSPFSARGNAMGNQSIGAELLGRDAAVRQRQAAAQQFGSNVQGLNLADIQSKLGVQAANQNQNDFVGRASQIFSSTLSDPFQAILGRSSGAGGGGGGGGQQQIGTGARLFDPTNPYAQDIYNTNYNAQASTNIANTQASNQQTSAIIGLIGSLLLSDRKLKRKIKTVGKSPSGIREVEFEYRTTTRGRKSEVGSRKPKRFRGYLAQDVEKVKPSAVFTLPSGHKAVNPHAIDAPFFQVGTRKSERRTKSLGELLAA